MRVVLSFIRCVNTNWAFNLLINLNPKITFGYSSILFFSSIFYLFINKRAMMGSDKTKYAGIKLKIQQSFASIRDIKILKGNLLFRIVF